MIKVLFWAQGMYCVDCGRDRVVVALLWVVYEEEGRDGAEVWVMWAE